MLNFQALIRTMQNFRQLKCAHDHLTDSPKRPDQGEHHIKAPRVPKTSNPEFFQLNPVGWPKLSKAATVDNFTAMPSATCTSLVVLGVQKKKSKHSKLQKHWISTNLGGHQN